MMRLPSLIIAFLTMLALCTALNFVFNVDYFYNAIFVASVGLALSDLIDRRLLKNLDASERNGS